MKVSIPGSQQKYLFKGLPTKTQPIAHSKFPLPRLELLRFNNWFLYIHLNYLIKVIQRLGTLASLAVLYTYCRNCILNQNGLVRGYASPL